MLKKSLGAVALLLFALLPPTLAAPAPDAGPRVSGLYTTWDDYFFYAAVQVRDSNVLGTNTTPTSQPQQDDDVEIFFETNNAKAKVRTPQTFQMAVSAANGSYFSVGDGGTIPQAKAVYTYKYAAHVDGTLNNPADSDTGYTVELAIPWQELGLSGPPKPGTVWGFNVISRDRQTPGTPGTRLYSLAPGVQSNRDVQNPSRWSQITFQGSDAVAASTPERVVCAQEAARFPTVDGVVASGEWPIVSRLAFGETAVTASAPTVAEEPNTSQSPFQAAQLQATQVPPPTTPLPPPTQEPNTIPLPGGGSIKIVPGGIAHPKGMEVPSRVAQNPNQNPLSPNVPPGYRPPGPNIALTGSLVLGPAKPPALVMAIYRFDYNGDGRKGLPQNVWDARGGSLLVDQPMNGSGPWFSGLRPTWHRQQLTDMRRSGINVALLRVRADDPLLPRELDALTEALKEMKAQSQDYPLIGLEAGPAQFTPLLPILAAHVPAEFRATLPGAATQSGDWIEYVPTGATPSQGSPGLSPTQIAQDDPQVRVVSPGRATDTKVMARQGGERYSASWQKALAAKPGFVVVDSWNDFTNGSEVGASRQYGEEYADLTKVQTIAFNGNKEWHAKYLSERTPRAIRPKVLYQVPIRIENAGTLPWRAGEGYSLCPRWYKDGRLYDDSAPRVPLGVDILPGQSATVSVGLTARNAYGDDLEPGQYTLVFDMVQGQDRWFSYADDVPLQVPVTVLSAGESEDSGPQAVFLGTQTPVTVQAGASYPTRVRVRNEGAASWPAGAYTLAYKIQTVSGDQVQTVVESAGTPLVTAAVFAGAATDAAATVVLNDAQGKPLPTGAYRLHWFLRPTAADGKAVTGAYDEALDVVSSDPGASFILSDIPRTVEAGRDVTARLAVQNLGAAPWSKSDTRIGYHWYYLDGVEQQWDGGTLSPLSKDTLPVGAIDGGITAKFRAPTQPGRYTLVFDVRRADGTWASTAPAAKGDDLLPVLVRVTGADKGSMVAVDLTAAMSENGDFDGKGQGLPTEMLPPDGTAEVDTNPLLQGRPGPPLYPSGFYAAQIGKDDASNHSVPFLYPPASSMVICSGQTVALPDGRYKAIHLLAAATGGQPVTVEFALSSGGGSQSLTIADWGTAPDTPGARLAFRSPYRAVKEDAVPTPACLGDYTMPLSGSLRNAGLVLPKNPAIKILAVSLEK